MGRTAMEVLDNIPGDLLKVQRQLATTLTHLKAVLGEEDREHSEPIFCMDCGCTLMVGQGLGTCANPDCPRYQARQWLKKMGNKL